MEYIVRLENFEGPFELLLELIRKKQMNIFDLQISEITKDYMSKLEEMKEQDIHVTSDFLEMASILLQIKTKMLIPKEENAKDPRDELVQQLLDYKEYKEAVSKMKELKEIEQRFFKRQKVDSIRKKKKGTIQDLIKSYQRIFSEKFQGKEKNKKMMKLAEELTRFKYTIEDRMEHVKHLLSSGRIDIEPFFKQMEDKEECIVTFSALLELVKIQYIAIYLDNEKVFIERKDVSNE